MLEKYFSFKHLPGLFRSTEWLQAWESAWGKSDNVKWLNREAVKGFPLASAILSFKQRQKKILPVITAFPLGVTTSAAKSLRAEYFHVPSQVASKAEYINEYFASASQLKWSQFYLPDLLLSSEEYELMQQQAAKHHCAWVIKDKDVAYGINLTGITFSSYLQSLGKNTRLKLFNRRKQLATCGEISLKNMWPDQTGFYQLLNNFHEQRWGKPCYTGRNLLLITECLTRLAESGQHINLSVLSVNDQPVSVVLDVCVNGRIYNLQSGYLENFTKGVSLGTLHFGYQIEAAFAEPNIDFYDFMVGKGKNSHYKSALANCSAEVHTVLLVRSWILKILYKWLY